MDIQKYRGEQYAHLAAVLDVNHETPGAAAIFDQAVTLGLAAIVAREWPGSEGKENWLKPAKALLDIVAGKAHPTDDGLYLLDELRGGGPGIEIDVTLLREAINFTQGIRHARGDGEVKWEWVRALIALDAHEVLTDVTGLRQDADWAHDMNQNRLEQRRAQRYLALLDEDEVDRRAALAEEEDPSTPDEHFEADTCPVCSRETLWVSGTDAYGAGIGSGTCPVCSYTRTPRTAETLATDASLARRLAWD
jgi:hypothetical protein